MSSPTPIAHLLSPSSPQDDDSNNGMDTFPPLTETPAAMSPVPRSTEQGAQSGNSNHEPDDQLEDDDTWSTDSEHEDDYTNAVHRITGSGTDHIDSRSIYHALFGGGITAPSRRVPARVAEKVPEIPVYKLSLGAADVPSCVKLEEACFANGASKDKIAYRIRNASGLNVGLFTTVFPNAENTSLVTYPTSVETETGSGRRTVLVAHIIATQTTNDRIFEEDDGLPPAWEKAHTTDHSNLGHKPFGKTVAVHSFGVLPQLRHKNIGTCLWKSFTQMIKSSKSYTRIAITVPKEQAAWFKKHNFRVLGQSVLKDENGHAKVDMVIDYSEDDDSDEEDEAGEEDDAEGEEDEAEEEDEDFTQDKEEADQGRTENPRGIKDGESEQKT